MRTASGRRECRGAHESSAPLRRAGTGMVHPKKYFPVAEPRRFKRSRASRPFQPWMDGGDQVDLYALSTFRIIRTFAGKQADITKVFGKRGVLFSQHAQQSSDGRRACRARSGTCHQPPPNASAPLIERAYEKVRSPEKRSGCCLLDNKSIAWPSAYARLQMHHDMRCWLCGEAR